MWLLPGLSAGAGFRHKGWALWTWSRMAEAVDEAGTGLDLGTMGQHVAVHS